MTDAVAAEIARCLDAVAEANGATRASMTRAIASLRAENDEVHSSVVLESFDALTTIHTAIVGLEAALRLMNGLPVVPEPEPPKLRMISGGKRKQRK